MSYGHAGHLFPGATCRLQERDLAAEISIRLSHKSAKDLIYKAIIFISTFLTRNLDARLTDKRRRKYYTRLEERYLG
jgi:hypothetical protein